MSDHFIGASKQIQAKNYSTNHIMMTLGGDFQYMNADQNFKNTDQLIKYVNQRVNTPPRTKTLVGAGSGGKPAFRISFNISGQQWHGIMGSAK